MDGGIAQKVPRVKTSTSLGYAKLVKAIGCLLSSEPAIASKSIACSMPQRHEARPRRHIGIVKGQLIVGSVVSVAVSWGLRLTSRGNGFRPITM